MDDPLGFGAVVRLLLPLALIVGGLLVVRRVAGRTTGGGPAALRVLGRAALTRTAGVALVQVDGRRFLVGAAEGGVTLLQELDADESAPELPPPPTGRTGVVQRLRDVTVRSSLALYLAVAALTLAAAPASAQVEPPPPPAPEVPDVGDVPDVGITVESDDPALSRTVVIVLLLTVGSVAPGLLLLMTTFTRFVVVLGLAKNALALQTIPPSQVLVGLALFLTFFAMNPVLREVNQEALQPLLAGDIGQEQALDAGFDPLRRFMLAQTRDDDLELFIDLSGTQPATPSDVPAATLIPAFVISELRTAFITGFVIFVPFLVIDLVVAAVLMSLGMVMLPPVFISLPLKLLLFVLVDGWVLIVGSIVGSVNAVAG